MDPHLSLQKHFETLYTVPSFNLLDAVKTKLSYADVSSLGTFNVVLVFIIFVAYMTRTKNIPSCKKARVFIMNENQTSGRREQEKGNIESDLKKENNNLLVLKYQTENFNNVLQNANNRSSKS